MKNKCFLLLIVLFAVVSAGVFVVLKPSKFLSDNIFIDVPPPHENYEAINFVQENAIVNGYPDSTFRPDNTVNRAEFTKIIVESVMPGEAGGENCFKDIKNEWFAKYVCYAQKKAVLSGYPDGYFRPEKPIAFTEAAKIISNTFSLSRYTNISPYDEWYKKPVTELELAGAIPESIDDLGKFITRGELAEIIYRLKTSNKDKESPTPENLNTTDSEKILSKFTPPESAMPSRFNLPFPMDFDENGQPSKGIYSIEDSSKDFFDDERSLQILSGEKTYDMTTYDLCRWEVEKPFVTTVKDDYGEKILNALMSLGYFQDFSCGSGVYDALYLFQKKHDLPESKIIDKQTLQALDDELKKIRNRDYLAAKDFICSQYIVDAPNKNARPKNHLAFLYSLALSAFPNELQLENTRRGCFEGQTFIVSDTKRAICDGLYWVDYDKNCEPRQEKVYLPPVYDYEIVSTILHEHAHTLGMQSLNWGSIDSQSFYEISYDPKDKFYTDDLYLKPRFDSESEEEKRDHLCSWYGLGWQSKKHPGYFTPHEDFAECVRMYVTDGIPFRDVAKKKPAFKEKYEWLKKNVFEGREFSSGDPDYLTYVDDFYDLSPAKMTLRRPDYVWDYDFHPVEGPQPLDKRNKIDQKDNSNESQVHFMYVIPSDGSDEKLDINGAIETSTRIMQGWFKARSSERPIRIDRYQGSPDITFLKLKKTNAEILASKNSLKEAIEAELKTNGFDDKDKIYAVYYGGTASECGDSSWPPNDPGNTAILYINGILQDGSPCGGDETFKKRRYEIGYFEYKMLQEILHAMGFVSECYKYGDDSGFSNHPQDIMYDGDEKWDPQMINSSFYDYFLGENDENCDLLPGDEFLEEEGEAVIYKPIAH